MMSSLLQEVVSLNVRITLLIGFVLLVRRCFFYRLPKQTFWGLWLVVLLRMLCPGCFSITVQIPALFPVQEDTVQTDVSSPDLRFSPVEERKAQIEPTAQDGAYMGVGIGAIWAAGAAGVFLQSLIRHRETRRITEQSLPISSDWAKRWMRSHRIRRRYTLRRTDRISTPLTCGIFRPVVLLPSQLVDGDDKSLELILEHEWVHIRRFDVLIKLVLLLVNSLYWYNPFVWLMRKFLVRDMEISCDEVVLNSRSRMERKEYCLTLLRFAAMPDVIQNADPFRTGLCEGGFEERMNAIMKKRKYTKFSAMLIVICLLIGTCSFVALAVEEEPNSAKTGEVNVVLPIEPEVTTAPEIPMDCNYDEADTGEVIYLNGDTSDTREPEIVEDATEDDIMPLENHLAIERCSISTAGNSWTQPSGYTAYRIWVSNTGSERLKVTVSYSTHSYVFYVAAGSQVQKNINNAWAGYVHTVDFTTASGAVYGEMAVRVSTTDL